MKNNLRPINEEEMRKLNPLISKKFGNLNMIVSGSFETVDGKKRYNIGLYDPNTYKPLPLLRNIGKIVKKTLEADEVFHNGAKIA